MMFYLIVIFGLASSLYGQLSSSELRAKFGPPLNRETFTVRPGVQMIVDYSPTANHACRLEFPGEAPFPKDVGPGVGVNLKKLMDDIVAEIVPPAMRGKETGKMVQMAGLASVQTTTFEHLTISEPMTGNSRTAVIVTFQSPDCVIQAVP
jgi:hypothetical protein